MSDYYEEKYGPRLEAAVVDRYLSAKGVAKCTCGSGKFVVEVDSDDEQGMAFVGGLLNPPQNLIFMSYLATCDHCGETKIFALDRVAEWVRANG